MSDRAGWSVLSIIGTIIGVILGTMAILGLAVQLGSILQNLTYVQASVDSIKLTVANIPLDRDRLQGLQKRMDEGAQKDVEQDAAIKRVENSVLLDSLNIARIDKVVQGLSDAANGRLRGGRTP